MHTLLEQVEIIGLGGFDGATREDAPRSVSLLTSREVSQVGAPAVADVLELAPGVDVRTRGPGGIQTDVSIRGASFEQFALIVDGVRWSAPHTGHHLMNLPMDAEDLASVAVVRGGAGALVGTGGFAGAIALRTARAKSNETTGGQIAAEAGAYGWWRVRASGDVVGDCLTQRISLSRAETDGYAVNTDATMTRALWTGEWKDLRGGAWLALAGVNSKAFGAQNFYTASYPHQFEATQLGTAQVTRRQETALGHWDAGVYARVHADRFELYREGDGWYEQTDDGFYVRPELVGPIAIPADTAGLYAPGAAWYQGANIHRSSTVGAVAKAVMAIGPGDLVVGADVRREAIRSNRLGLVLEDPADSILVKADDRLNVDARIAYAYEHPTGRLQATAAGAVNWNSRFELEFLPALEAAWQPAAGVPLRVFASANRSVRQPSYTDLYYTVGGAIGSTELQTERASHAELGWRYAADQNGRWIVEAAYFVRQGENMIDWVRLDDDSTNAYRAKNLSEIQYAGVDAALEWRAEQGEVKGVSYARLSGLVMQADRVSEGFESSYALDFLSQKLDFVVGLNLPLDLRADVRVSYQQREGDYSSPIAEDVQLYEPVTLVGLTVRRAFLSERLMAHIRIDNALNSEYNDYGNVIQPGRWWRMGFTFDLD